MMYSFICNRQQKTVVNNTETDWISLHQNVPQDTIMGPLTFSLCINDLTE